MTKEPIDVLYDSAAALRLVDTALRDIAGIDVGGEGDDVFEAAAPSSAQDVPGGRDDASAVLLYCCRELRAAVDELRNTRPSTPVATSLDGVEVRLTAVAQRLTQSAPTA